VHHVKEGGDTPARGGGEVQGQGVNAEVPGRQLRGSLCCQQLKQHLQGLLPAGQTRQHTGGVKQSLSEEMQQSSQQHGEHLCMTRQTSSPDHG